MDYPDAINLLHRARLHLPALVYLNGQYYVFSRSTMLGHGGTITKALESAGLLPERERAAAVQFSAVGANVLRGDAGVCVARSHNMALRIAAALNHYKPSDRGF